MLVSPGLTFIGKRLPLRQRHSPFVRPRARAAPRMQRVSRAAFRLAFSAGCGRRSVFNASPWDPRAGLLRTQVSFHFFDQL
jgi:hypothetical protein